ncbi:unnamed protein product [Pedinophyceae sp. YPF-701]|nr:unnamed protein product [Pedinophyceae sp. YPF-701]
MKETDDKPAPPPRWRIVAGDLAAGATAGAAVEAALYPIDTIKTRLQAMRSGGGIRALLQSGGGKALYAGLWGNLAGVAPASALFMAVYEPAKNYLPAHMPEGTRHLSPMAAGALAGLASSVIRVPTEVIKQRMQTGEFKKATVALRTVAVKEGVRGLYAGYGSFLLRDLPFDALEFFAYERTRVAYREFVGRDLHPAETSLIGATAGAVTGWATTPLDVLKTRLMTQGAAGEYKGVVDCAVKIIRDEGVGAMFRGWEPRVTWIGVGGCVFFSALEAAKTAYRPKGYEPPAQSGGQ